MHDRAITSHQTVRLSRGKHASPDSGVCVMELASMLAGEPFSDRPESVSRVVGSFLRSYNDAVDDSRRQELYAVAAKIVGSASGLDIERTRAEHCREVVGVLHADQSRLRRWLSPRPRTGGGLEDAGVQLARVVRRRGAEGHELAMRFVDELVAIGGRAERGVAAPAPAEALPVA